MTDTNGRIKLGVYTITEVFKYIDASPRHGQKVDFHGHDMHMRCPKLLSFRYNGIRCVRCGSIGAFFCKEHYGTNNPHLNLYSFDNYGQPMLMTRDHIRPKSKGGTNHLYNSQTMCTNCNNKKDNAWGLKDRLKYWYRKLFKNKMGLK